MSASNTIEQPREIQESQPKARGGAKPRNRNAWKAGLCAAKAAIKDFGSAAIDGRTTAGKLLAEIESGFYSDEGGRDACSTAERVLIRILAVDTLFLSSLDTYLLQQPTLVLKRKKTTLPLLQQRNQLAAGLAQRLGQLGFERRPAPTQSLAEYLAKKAAESAPASAPGPEAVSPSAVATENAGRATATQGNGIPEQAQEEGEASE